MFNKGGYAYPEAVRACADIIDGCSRQIRFIALTNHGHGFSEEWKRSFAAWEQAFRRLETDARQYLASGGYTCAAWHQTARHQTAWGHMAERNQYLMREFNRFLQTHPIQRPVGSNRGDCDCVQIVDHAGRKVCHRRETVNGVRLHYVTAGSGEPLLLLHGAPKTSFYWYKLIPLLTDRYTVIAPDTRGFGDSDKPQSGYGMNNIAEDFAQLMDKLGHRTYSIHGEDWGAAFAYALSAKYPDRVKKLSFSEMLLPGLGLEAWSLLKPENVNSHHWFWHINFFAVPDVPEFLITGKERAFWGKLMRDECLDPSAITEPVLDEVVRGCSGAGGLRPIFEVYRQDFENIRFVNDHLQHKLTMPVIAIAGVHFMDGEVHREAALFAEHVTPVSLDCGHCLALERPAQLAGLLRDFLG